MSKRDAGVPLEKAVQGQGIAVLKRRKCWYYNTRTGGFGRNGVPDVIGCYKGVFFAIEFKRPTASSQATKPQLRELAAIGKAGGVPIIARSAQDVTDMLDNIDAMLFNRATGSDAE